MDINVLYISNTFSSVFRSPSCMAISRSYPRHLVKFCEKRKTQLFMIINIFIMMHLFFCIWLFIQLRIPPSYTAQLYRLVIPLGYTTRLYTARLYRPVIQSEYLVSLSYPMAIFSANSFGLLYKLWFCLMMLLFPIRLFTCTPNKLSQGVWKGADLTLILFLDSQ